MDIHPIRNDDDHRMALSEIERLWNAPEGSEDEAKLDILATLVEKYEVSRWPIESADFDPIDILHYAMAEMGHTQSELSELLESRSRASEILSRHRPLTIEMIRLISEAWKIPVELLIKRYRVPVAA